MRDDSEAVPGADDAAWVPAGWSSQSALPPGHGTHQDRAWATATHLSIFAFGIAFPLVIVLWKGHRSPYVCHQAIEALNFQTTVLLAVILCTMLSAVLAGALLMPVVLVTAAALAVRAALRASRGAWHRYPFILRFVS